MIYILRSLYSIANYMLAFIKICLLVEIFMPAKSILDKEGIVPLIREITAPAKALSGKALNLGPISLSPILIFTLIDILRYAMS